jgi:replicative DNA helicase
MQTTRQIAQIGASNQRGDEAPHNVEAEQQVLGALLCNNDLIEKIVGTVTKDTFYDPVHADVFEAISTRIADGQLASPVTLKTALQSHQGLSELGGPKYLVNLAGGSVSTFAIAEYGSLIADLHAKRQLLDHIRDASDRIREGHEGVASISSRLETRAGMVAGSSSTKPLIRSHLSTLMGAMTEISEAYQGITPPGVSTGLPALDARLGGGLRGGQFILMGGRPAMGKTTVAQNIAYHCASNGHAVFFGSMEMMGEELAKRFLSKGLAERNIRIPYLNMIKGNLTESDMRAVVDEARRQEALPISVAEREVREETRLRSSIRRAQQYYADTATPLGLIVLDYLQLIQSEKARSTYDRISAASDACKSLAMETGLPVLALSQLSRKVEERETPIPMLSDLRESGKLEEDADVVMFTYRDAYYLEKKIKAAEREGDTDKLLSMRADLEATRYSLDILIEKQRSGPTGSVQAFLEPEYCHMAPDRSEHDGELI